MNLKQVETLHADDELLADEITLDLDDLQVEVLEDRLELTDGRFGGFGGGGFGGGGAGGSW